MRITGNRPFCGCGSTLRSTRPRDIARPANRRRRAWQQLSNATDRMLGVRSSTVQRLSTACARWLCGDPGVMEPPTVGSIERSASKLNENTLESEFSFRLTGWLLAGLVL